MQNRFVISDIPLSISRLPKAKDSLREFVEEHSCWVDRFAFLTCNRDDDDDSCVAAIELHIENVRDKAIKVLDGLIVSMDQEGNINNDNNGCISFELRARPASISESSQLVQQCQIESDDVIAESKMEKQTLKLRVLGKEDHFDTSILLTIRKSIEHGGTGTFPWRGGLLLANQICRWVGEYIKRKEIEDGDMDYFSVFFGNNKTVLELGAGSTGLPSLLLGKIMSSENDNDDMNMKLICSDGVDEIIQGLRINVSDNELGECITVKHIDWNDYTHCDKQGDTDMMVDTIIFADCIYNDECAIALNQTIRSLLKSGGYVVGIVPGFRVGVDVFETLMKERYTPIEIPIAKEKVSDGFVCNGGRGKDYRLIVWRDI